MGCFFKLDEVLTACLQRDAEKAKQAVKTDDATDTGQAILVEKLFTIVQADPGQVPDVSRILWISP